MAQAFIFAGEDSEAVRKRALNFAKRLNCETENACDACTSCRVFQSGNHPDTIFVKGTKQTGIGVDDVREQIIMPAAQLPFKYKHKVFIADEPLLPAAQNAVLKTIEEPPPYGVFLFLAQNTHGFLPTVISRCAVKKIAGEGRSEKSDLQTLAREIFDAAKGADIAESFALYRKIEPLEKHELPEFLSLLYILCGKAQRFSASAAVSHTRKILSQNANAQLAIELMLLKMR
ncbi:MAG: hypothetical protein FWF77_05220 [Defluviitaleaceae bacterium]|nr:hypothetical protein [Defluviitaleaceae bacterium]